MSKPTHTFRRGERIYARPGTAAADVIGPNGADIVEAFTDGRIRIERHRLIIPITQITRDPAIGPTARNTDPPTSHHAAAKAAETFSKSAAAALEHLALAGERGLTDFELADRTGYKQTSIGKRRGDLVRAGLVHRLDETRYSDTNTPSSVWAITPAGIAAWRSRLGKAS